MQEIKLEVEVETCFKSVRITVTNPDKKSATLPMLVGKTFLEKRLGNGYVMVSKMPIADDKQVTGFVDYVLKSLAYQNSEELSFIDVSLSIANTEIPDYSDAYMKDTDSLPYHVEVNSLAKEMGKAIEERYIRLFTPVEDSYGEDMSTEEYNKQQSEKFDKLVAKEEALEEEENPVYEKFESAGDVGVKAEPVVDLPDEPEEAKPDFPSGDYDVTER